MPGRAPGRTLSSLSLHKRARAAHQHRATAAVPASLDRLHCQFSLDLTLGNHMGRPRLVLKACGAKLCSPICSMLMTFAMSMPNKMHMRSLRGSQHRESLSAVKICTSQVDGL